MLRSELLCLGFATSLGALGCADESPTPKSDSGQSATASDAGIDASREADASVALDGAHPDVDTGAGDASRPDAGGDAGGRELSCEQLTRAASNALRGALDSRGSCAVDADCKTVWLTTTCYDGCAAVVSGSQAQPLASALKEQNETSCAAFKARGCSYLAHPCDPPGPPACIAGECRAYAGSVPVAGPDGGAGIAPVVLDNPASPATAELRAGQRLELTLQSIGPGSYTEATVSAVALRFVESFLAGMPNPGGPTKVFVFEAISPGTVQVSVPHSARPDPFELTVTIR